MDTATSSNLIDTSLSHYKCYFPKQPEFNFDFITKFCRSVEGDILIAALDGLDINISTERKIRPSYMLTKGVSQNTTQKSRSSNRDPDDNKILYSSFCIIYRNKHI